MQRMAIITALAHEARKSLLLLEAVADCLGHDPTSGASDPLNGVILRRRRSAARLRSLLRAEGADRTLPPMGLPVVLDAGMVMAAEAKLLAYLERWLLRVDLPDDLRHLITEQREDVHQATLILSRIRAGNG